MRIIYLLLIAIFLSGCAVPNIVAEITNQVITGKEKEEVQKKAVINTMD